MFSLVPVDAYAQDRPALVVLLTVDQLRPDYLDRFASDLTGGFARLAREGAFFTRGMQDHAITSTAPGHATLWSGRFPANTGIISNDLGVPDPSHPLVDGADGPGASPHRFRGTALYDWLHAADEETRMLSVSRKDRGAILPVGTARVPTFWWSADGRFTTSTYYSDTLPTWVTRWNDRLKRAQWSGRTWSLALPEQAYPEPDDRPYEGVGAGRGNTFPHRMGSIRDLEDFPWMDSLTLELALTGMRELELGRRGATDLMAVSLSTLDAIRASLRPRLAGAPRSFRAVGPLARHLHVHSRGGAGRTRGALCRVLRSRRGVYARAPACPGIQARRSHRPRRTARSHHGAPPAASPARLQCPDAGWVGARRHRGSSCTRHGGGGARAARCRCFRRAGGGGTYFHPPDSRRSSACRRGREPLAADHPTGVRLDRARRARTGLGLRSLSGRPARHSASRQHHGASFLPRPRHP